MADSLSNYFIRCGFLLVFLNFMMKDSIAQFDLQGHRGCRGELPENTIPAFLRAIDAGVTTLEMDVVVTSDHQVLVSHEPYMSHHICKTSSGESISKRDERNHNIYKMTAADAKRYDCGMTVNKRFPDQKKMKVGKPLLTEVIDSVESYLAEKGLPQVNYNIEIKSSQKEDAIFHPVPEVFAELLMKVVKENRIEHRTWLQSFDVRILQNLKNTGANVKLGLLVENIRGVQFNLRKLGFVPDMYGPWYRLLRKKDIALLHEKGIRVIPWTVNNPKIFTRLKQWGVDGIITDYPTKMVTIVN